MTTNQASSVPRKGFRNPTLPVLNKRSLYSLFLLGMLAGYIVLIWKIERIDLSRDMLSLPLRELSLQMFSIFVHFALHFIPVILGWLVASTTATNLLFYLYDLQDLQEARGFLKRLQRSNGSNEVISVTPQTIEAIRNDSTFLRVGGPCLVRIPAGNIATSEINSRFHRIVPSGTQKLDRFEYLHTILDLHPQERSNLDVRLFSRESLEVTSHVSVTFRISTGNTPPTPEQPFPYDTEAVKKLAYAQTNLPDKRVGIWDSLALGTVIGALARIVSTFPIDDLLQDSQTRMGAHLTIRRQTEREARAKLREHGIDLMRVRIGRFRFPDDVTTQHMQNWRVNWELAAKSALAEGEAGAQTLLEIANAEAELGMVRAVVQEVRQAQQDGYQGSIEDIVALRFIDMLDRLARQTKTTAADQLLSRLQNIQQQLQNLQRLPDRN